MTNLRARLEDALGDSYTIERELGGGGMSRVFVAEETRFHRTVVIKLLSPELAEGLSAERFEREIAVAAALQEPHIVPVITAGDVGGLPWYSMPFVAGESLRERLNRGAVPLDEATSILRNVASALAYAHERGIVHRDIKPENILLSSGTAVVTDFGIAKALSASRTRDSSATFTRVGTSLGTPAYMAPEQAVGEDVDARADVYAWGVVAYELLAKRHPFSDSKTAQQFVAAHISEPPPELTGTATAIPAPLANLVMRALEKDRARRPESGRAVLDALSDALRNAHGTSAVARGGMRISRRRTVALIAACVASLGVAAFALRTGRKDVPTDARLIAVLPFRVAGADPALAYLREGMLDLLAAKLTGSTRVADPRAVMAAWRRAGGSATTDVDPATAATLAARLGAREMVLGDITMSGPANVVLHAALVPTAGGPGRDASVQGPRDSVSSLVDQLAVRLLALRGGQDVRTIDALAGTPISAIRDYLEGAALMRVGSYRGAQQHFTAAVRTDSNFAVAWVGVLDAAGWMTDAATADSASVRIVRLRDKLTPATRALMDAKIGTNYPLAPTRAETRYLAEHAVQVAPDNPAAWEYLGEVLYHWGAVVGLADAQSRAIGAYERALALDSGSIPALEHLSDLYYERGDTASMHRTIESRLARDSTASSAIIKLFLADAVFGDARRGTEWRALARATPVNLGLVAHEALIVGRSLDAVDSALSAASARGVTDAEQGRIQVMAMTLALIRGQPAKAARIARGLPRALNAPVPAAAANVVAALLADGDSTLAAEGRAVLAAAMASDAARVPPDAWIAASIDGLARGDTGIARRAVTRLRASPTLCEQRVPGLCADYAMIVDAELAAAEKRPDAHTRLVELDSMLVQGPLKSGVLLQMGNLVASRLWEKSGDRVRALAAVRRRPRFWDLDVAVATSLREEGRLAAATGDRDGAIRAYRLYLAIREDAEPSLKPHLDGVRRELARLEREGGK